MAASLGWMSIKGLFPIPRNTLSCKRTSKKITCETICVIFKWYIHWLIVPLDMLRWVLFFVFLLWNESSKCSNWCVFICRCRTSVVYSLFPEYPFQVPGPSLLHFTAGCLQSVCVLTFPLSEPDLKTQTGVTGVLCHSYVRGLNTEKDNVFVLDYRFL